MKRTVAQILTLTMSFSTLPAQKIENETPARDRVVRVQTAMNHLTVIEVAEPVITVAVGSPQAFKIERRENKVFIQPLEENVATNLFIWTASTRLNYELIPAVSDAGQMDFAIDYRPQPKAELKEPKTAEPAALVSDLPGEMLLNGSPVRLAGTEPKTNPGLLIRDVYRKNNEVFVRYSIENKSNQTLRAGSPTVNSLTKPRTDKSLWGLENTQLGVEHISKLRTGGAPVSIKVIRADPGTTELAPGAMHVGLVGFELPADAAGSKSEQPTVLQIQVPIDRGGNAIATLVL